MAGPVLALQLLLTLAYFVIIIVLAIFTVINRHSLIKSIPAGLICLALILAGINSNRMKSDAKHEASKIFLGDYKLNSLDYHQCDSCIVRLYDDYAYDIFVNGKAVGRGKWNIETASDIPGYFLKVENGPSYVIWEKDRLIESIVRPEAREDMYTK